MYLFGNNVGQDTEVEQWVPEVAVVMVVREEKLGIAPGEIIAHKSAL